MWHIHAVERRSVKKEQNIWYDKDEPQEHANGKKLDANDHTSYDGHMKCPQQEHSQKQKEELSLSRAAGGSGK